MRYIERINVSGFKSIRRTTYRGNGGGPDLGLPLGDLNVLIGANGAGKSNFLSFLELLATLAQDADNYEDESEAERNREHRLRNYVSLCGGAEHILYYHRTHPTLELKGSIWFKENPYPPRPRDLLSYEFVLAPTGDDNRPFIFQWELCRLESRDDSNQFSGGRPFPKALFAKGPAPDTVRERFQQMAPIHVYHFPDAGGGSVARRAADIDDNRYLRSQGENVAAFLFLLKTKHPAEYRQIVNVVRIVFPFFEDFELAPLELNENKIKLEWKESGDDGYRDVSYLSDGTLRFICLATLLLQPKPPGLILIDEPELGLHPYAIGVLADLLKAASTKSQLIVSTQSVTLVNQMGPEDIIVVEREKEPESSRYETVFKRLEKADLEQWLQDYGMGDLWEKNLIGGRP